MAKIYIVVFILNLLCSCGSQDEYNKLQNENVNLKNELNDIKFGADKLLKQAKVDYSNKQYDQATEKINLLIEKHNETAEAQEGRKLQELVNIKRAELEELSYWYNVSENDTSSITNYLLKYPSGKFVKQAHVRYTKAIANFETQAYKNALSQNSSSFWRSFLELYPNRLDVASIRKKIIQAEITEIRVSDNVTDLPSSYQTDDGYSNNSNVTITNNTGYTLTVRYSGPTITSVTIAAGDSETVYLHSGSYQVGATAGSASCAGNENLHGSYISSYVITTTSSRSYYR